MYNASQLSLLIIKMRAPQVSAQLQLLEVSPPTHSTHSFVMSRTNRKRVEPSWVTGCSWQQLLSWTATCMQVFKISNTSLHSGFYPPTHTHIHTHTHTHLFQLFHTYTHTHTHLFKLFHTYTHTYTPIPALERYKQLN